MSGVIASESLSLSLSLNQTPQTTNCYPTQDVFPSLLFLYCTYMYVPNQIAPAYVSAAIFNIFSHINSKIDEKWGRLLYPIKALYTA